MNITASMFKTLNSNCFELSFLILLQSNLVFGHLKRLPEVTYCNFGLVLGRESKCEREGDLNESKSHNG